MKLAVILPVHNEEEVLKPSLGKIWAWARERFGAGGFEIVVSENGSTDGTRHLAEALCRDLPGTSLVASVKPGKGGAIRRAAAAVEADVYIMMDIDLSTDLASVEKLVEAVSAGAGLAVSSRRMPDSVVERPLLRRVITAAYAGIAGAALGLDLRDLQCGCKAFSREVRDRVLPAVADDGFFFDTELIAKVKKAGLRIEEIGARWDERNQPKRRSKVRLVHTGARFIEKLAALRKDLEK